MAHWIPTQPGDMLILKTATQKSWQTFVVGPVREDGQQDFLGQHNIRYATHLTEAIAMAGPLLVSGGQIFLRDVDTRDWSTVTAMQNLAVLQERKIA